MDNNWQNTDLIELEKNIIAFWKNINATDKILQQVNDYPEKIFLDGPPFATGTMHYGHILVSSIKDTIIRYFTMKGYKVDRRNSWDCHGVPIEMLAKKVIGYTTKKELYDYGINNHNDICRNLVLKCADRWYQDFERIGRWIDVKNEYKTMDTNFMESVIWAFKQLYERGMIFEGYKVMPYSTGCNTALSHFEAKQNYREVVDPSITCCFEIISTQYSVFKHTTDYPNYILAWTTTPWTLPSNMALCTYVGGEITYAFDNQLKCYILISKHKFEATLSKLKFANVSRFRIISRISSDDIVGTEYKPPYNYFWNREELEKIPIENRAFRVVSDHYVKESGQDSGTGFVQCAPAHGEDDFRVCCMHGIIDMKNSRGNLINVIDDDGKYKEEIKHYAGLYIKDVDNLIIKYLKSNNLLFDFKQYKHSYPHCYRTDTPLLYRVSTGWFLNASDETFREKMLNNNSKINWMPSNIGTKHFDNWLQNSVDWCISRSRFWGTPIPVWKSDDGEEIICVGSIKELQELSGVQNISDLHIDKIDHIKIPSKKGKGLLSRVEGVLDCWFESGSMPYGQIHYPFDNAKYFDNDKDYVADFVTESIDQTRGWFYTLLVLSTAIFDKPAFKNVIVTGIVNASDGQKMSKSKGNYSDPNILIDKFGADTLRLYLLSSPVVKAESIKFDEIAMAKLQQNSIVKIYNMALFLTEKISLFIKENPTEKINSSRRLNISDFSNIIDKWIINKTNIMVRELNNDFSCYNIHRIGSKIINHIEQLTNWYLKMSRERMKGFASMWFSGNEDWKQSIKTLLTVLHHFIIAIAPVLPFISETVYQMIKPYLDTSCESVHFESYIDINETDIDQTLEEKFETIQQVICMVRDIRKINHLNNRRPIYEINIGCINPKQWDIIQDVLDIIKIECNTLNIKYVQFNELVGYQLEPNISKLSTYLKNNNKIKNMRDIINLLKNISETRLSTFLTTSKIEIEEYGIILDNECLEIKYYLLDVDNNSKILDGMIVQINQEYNEQVEKEHIIRLVNTAIQMHRKSSMLKPWNIIKIVLHTDSKYLINFINQNKNYFCAKNISDILLDESANLFRPTKHEIINDFLIIGSINT
ncbi:isoleucyl-tRNA synthetase [Acanthamoeba polyphaga mimivirus]|uniref:isoleucine--tRNA ligase n=1 Tax=Acanthamoeba polyphaga mimivirus TaxID=212035 RepID=A0A2L2DIU5_MIMIV|nr:isoleucyl-tRNA synthetase [Acanthamoeba polyphaga mimivirus]